MVNQYSSKVTQFATKSSTSVAREKHDQETKPADRKFNFTKKALAVLPGSASGQRVYYHDSDTRGLTLAVSPAGKKVFVLYRKVAGKPERITIGPYPDLTIEQARGKAAELNGAIARGENPAAKRRNVQEEMTLGELFATYLEHHAKPHKKSWHDDQEIFNLHLSAWKLRKVSDIRRMDVVTLHSRIGKSAKYQANRVVALLRCMFGKAGEWGWHGENPATKIKPFKEHKRERFLQPEEVPYFFEALGDELNETARDFFFIALLTGARRANVQAMRWEEINFPSATWTIPETKSGESVTVALTVTALGILENRKASSRSEFVFPGDGKSGHLVEPKAAWRRILERAATIQKKNWLEANPGKHEADFAKEFPSAGFQDLRIHDLRRTLGSWQANSGTSLPIIGKSLGHKSLAATQIYARLNIDPVRASVNKATDALLAAAKGPAKLLEDGNG
jgi:integrase